MLSLALSHHHMHSLSHPQHTTPTHHMHSLAPTAAIAAAAARTVGVAARHHAIVQVDVAVSRSEQP
jgi:hypothetical protein